MDAATIVRKARVVAGVTQTTLGQRAGVPQSRISEIERGHGDPATRKVLDLLKAVRHTLALLPTSAVPVHEAADEIREYLQQGNNERVFRRFLQLSDDLTREPLHLRIALACVPPDPVGHAGYDAALAALVEYLTLEAPSAAPPWVHDAWRVCEPGWTPSGDPLLAEYSRSTAPAPFRRCGAFISADDLVSV